MDSWRTRSDDPSQVEGGRLRGARWRRKEQVWGKMKIRMKRAARKKKEMPEENKRCMVKKQRGWIQRCCTTGGAWLTCQGPWLYYQQSASCRIAKILNAERKEGGTMNGKDGRRESRGMREDKGKVWCEEWAEVAMRDTKEACWCTSWPEKVEWKRTKRTLKWDALTNQRWL